jgi:hypothetical protein
MRPHHHAALTVTERPFMLSSVACIPLGRVFRLMCIDGHPRQQHIEARVQAIELLLCGLTAMTGRNMPFQSLSVFYKKLVVP